MTEPDTTKFKTQQVSPGIRYALSKNGIDIQKWTPNKNKKSPIKGEWKISSVFIGTYEPLEKLNIDGRTLFKVRTSDIYVMSMKDIINHLKTDGGVVFKAKLDDAVNAVSLNLPTKEGHATFGIYSNNGKLETCFEVMPYKDEQINIHRHAEAGIKEPITKESLEAYVELTKHWHPYEVLPSMGMSVMAPFALQLREKGKMVVILWHYAPKSHLGKSTVQRIFSFCLFSIYPSSGDKINSAFRFLCVIDSVCGFISVNEVDNVDWDKLDDIVKQFPENYEAGGRGSGDLSMYEYLSRAVVGITSNRFRVKNKNTLNRIFKIPYDMTKEGERNLYENTRKIDELVANLKPFGWRLVENELEFIDKSLILLGTVLLTI